MGEGEGRGRRMGREEEKKGREGDRMEERGGMR